MIVGLMGNDGSGKTTLGRRVAAELRRAGLRVQQRSEFDYFLLRYPLRLVPRRRKDAVSTRLVHETEETVRRARWLKLWPLVVLSDFAAERAVLAARRRSVVLTDRFAYDSLMSWESLGLAGPLVRRLYLALPPPDVGLVLDVPPEVAHERKRDTHWYPPSYYAQQRARYHAMAAERGLPLVRTDRPLDESVAEVLRRMGDDLVADLPPEERAVLRLAMRGEGQAEGDTSRILSLAARCGVEAAVVRHLDAPALREVRLGVVQPLRGHEEVEVAGEGVVVG
ncbi:MAG TPA: hypothetical protein VNX21_03365, partial [Candidatus Thermoplasmatota archaeon]|nr:hypothetical protein [Candidatus Thermoplasmatota archaeon]